MDNPHKSQNIAGAEPGGALKGIKIKIYTGNRMMRREYGKGEGGVGGREGGKRLGDDESPEDRCESTVRVLCTRKLRSGVE